MLGSCILIPDTSSGNVGTFLFSVPQLYINWKGKNCLHAKVKLFELGAIGIYCQGRLKNKVQSGWGSQGWVCSSRHVLSWLYSRKRSLLSNPIWLILSSCPRLRRRDKLMNPKPYRSRTYPTPCFLWQRKPGHPRLWTNISRAEVRGSGPAEHRCSGPRKWGAFGDSSQPSLCRGLLGLGRWFSRTVIPSPSSMSYLC